MLLTKTISLVQSTSELEKPAASSPGEREFGNVPGDVLVPDVKLAYPSPKPQAGLAWVSQDHGSPGEASGPVHYLEAYKG